LRHAVGDDGDAAPVAALAVIEPLGPTVALVGERGCSQKRETRPRQHAVAVVLGQARRSPRLIGLPARADGACAGGRRCTGRRPRAGWPGRDAGRPRPGGRCGRPCRPVPGSAARGSGNARHRARARPVGRPARPRRSRGPDGSPAGGPDSGWHPGVRGSRARGSVAMPPRASGAARPLTVRSQPGGPGC